MNAARKELALVLEYLGVPIDLQTFPNRLRPLLDGLDPGCFHVEGRDLVGKGKFTEADRRTMRIAALLRDIGHYPFSHLMEFLDRDRHRPSYLPVCGIWPLIESLGQ
jgi:hypothetical protein